MLTGTAITMRVEKLSKSFHVPSFGIGRSRFSKTTRTTRTLDVLRDIDATFHAGELARIVGESGAGKTTLLRVLCGILTPDHGCVYHFGRTTRLLDHGVLLNGAYTFEENLIRCRDFLGIERSDCVRIANEIVDKTDTRDVSDLPLIYCSQRVRTRLTCLLGLYSKVDLLLIDNQLPFGDVEFERCYWDEMDRFRARGGTVVIAVCNEYGIMAEVDRTYTLARGQLT